MRMKRSPGAMRFKARLLVGLTLGALVSGLVVGSLSQPAAAHANFEGAAPEPDSVVDEAPTEVVVNLSEPVEVPEDGIQVFGPDAEPVHRGAAEPLEGGASMRVAVDAQANGTYTVNWHVVSGDGHPIEGGFVFSVGERGATADLESGEDRSVDIAGAIGRWLAFVGTVVAMGSTALVLASPAERAVRARLRPVVFAGGLIGSVGVATVLVAQVADTVRKGLPESFADVPGEFGTRAVDYMGLRLAALVLVTVVALFLWKQLLAPPLVLGLGLASMALSSMVSHAWSAQDRDLTVVSDMVHFAAVSVWIGGLVALGASLRVARDAHRLAEKFSAMAFGAVVVVAPTGVVLGWQHLGPIDNLFETAYGRYLLAKLALFTVLLGFGWLNKTQLVALVRRSIMPLSRSLRGEFLVAVVLLGVTAVLVHEPPGRSRDPLGGLGAGEQAGVVSGRGTFGKEDGGPVTRIRAPDNRDPASGLVADLQLDVIPARAGDNDMYLHFFGADGAPLEVINPTVELSYGQLVPREVEPTMLSPSHIAIPSVAFPQVGSWIVKVQAVAIDLNQQVTYTFEVPIT